jgi:tRNA A58 N-methylase Trm61
VDIEVIIDVLRGYRTSDSLCLVELGSGFSTLALAHLLPRLHNNGHIVTIEGDDAYANQLRTQITAYDLDNVVNLYHIPYVVGTDECWFDSNALRKIIGDKKVDVLVVDAPPGGFCPHARQNAIPFFLSYLKQNSTVLLHDTIRQDESDIAKQWSRYFDAHHRVKTPSVLDVFERLV